MPYSLSVTLFEISTEPGDGTRRFPTSYLLLRTFVLYCTLGCPFFVYSEGGWRMEFWINSSLGVDTEMSPLPPLLPSSSTIVMARNLNRNTTSCRETPYKATHGKVPMPFQLPLRAQRMTSLGMKKLDHL